METQKFFVPATVSLDRALDAQGHVGATRLDVLLPQGADAAALAALAARLCASTPGLLGREPDVAAALTAALAPFNAKPAAPVQAGRGRVCCLEIVARTDGLTLTDRVVVDLSSPPGTEGAASLGAAVASDLGLPDSVASAYAAALSAAIAAARAGRGDTLAVEDAARWGVPKIVRG